MSNKTRVPSGRAGRYNEDGTATCLMHFKEQDDNHPLTRGFSIEKLAEYLHAGEGMGVCACDHPGCKFHIVVPESAAKIKVLWEIFKRNNADFPTEFNEHMNTFGTIQQMGGGSCVLVLQSRYFEGDGTNKPSAATIAYEDGYFSAIHGNCCYEELDDEYQYLVRASEDMEFVLAALDYWWCECKNFARFQRERRTPTEQLFVATLMVPITNL